MTRSELCVLVLARSPLRAKSRLAGLLGRRHRALLAEAMLRDVLAAALDAALGPLFVATESRRVERLALGHRAHVLRVKARGTRAAARAAASRLARSGHERVLAVPADLPLVRAGELARIAAAGRGAEVVIAPDRRGTGTNALLWSLGDLSPLFGPDSAGRHLAAARLAGLRTRVLRDDRVALDIDTLEDLRDLARRRHEAGGHTFAAIEAIGLTPSPPRGRGGGPERYSSEIDR